MPKNISAIQPLLCPIALVYGMVTWFRNRFYDWGIFKSTQVKIPTIVVGNITVGGTGKTPHIEYLVTLLKNSFKLATLSRGYKRETTEFLIASADTPFSHIGDEPKQIKSKFPEITVAVNGNRVEGIHQLMKQDENLELVLLDDAFQHRSLKAGFYMLMIDYNRPIFIDKMLPAGRLRESAKEKSRADIIIVSKAPKNLKPIDRREFINNLKPEMHQTVYFTSLEYSEPEFVFNSSACKTDLSETDILLVTGIANPEPLKKHLNNICKSVYQIKFPDHYNFKQHDYERIKLQFDEIESARKLIITTEKDAIRMKENKHAQQLFPDMAYIPIQVQFLFEENEKFKNQIVSYVRKNKRNNILYK